MLHTQIARKSVLRPNQLCVDGRGVLNLRCPIGSTDGRRNCILVVVADDGVWVPRGMCTRDRSVSNNSTEIDDGI